MRGNGASAGWSNSGGGSGGNGPSMGPREKYSLFGAYRLQWCGLR